MKTILKLTSCLLITFFASCSSDGGGAPQISDITLTTTAPQLVDGVFITSGGHASSNINEYETGICYSTTPNPTVINNIVNSNTATNTDFGATIDITQFGSTYYIKAFIRDTSTSEVKYGNEVSISVPITLSTGTVKGISANGFNVDITVGASLANNIERGICFGEAQNPGVGENNIQVVPITSTGAGTYTINVESYFDVSPNKNYYLRSYVRMPNSQYYYGNQQTFRSTGYIGGSGGYVFYDKGETTNGWRYLEAYSSAMIYNSSYYFYWSCNTNFTSGISNAIGAGKENSQAIKSICNYNNVASALCLDMMYNGQAAGTWFIPSIDELKELYKMKVTGVMNFGTGTITLSSSSQSSDIYCFSIPFNGSSSNGTVQLTGKQWSAQIAWPVRRF